MKALLAIAMAISTLFLGCSSSTKSSKASASPGIYVNESLHASFRVPTGWTAPTSWSPIKRKEPWTARFDSPGREASVIAGQAPFAGINCVVAAQAALRAVSGSALQVEKEFELKANLETLVAGTGSTSSNGRQGMARYFCRGKTAVVVEASATTAAYGKRQSELETIVDSVSYEENSQQIAIRPPQAPSQTFFQHTVKSRNQTLGQIAEWYTGDYENWKKLARFNDDTPVPNVALKVGREIKIPIELVTRQTPMPEPKRRRKEATTSKSTAKDAAPTEKTAQKAPAEASPSEEEVAETTGVPPNAEEEELPELPPVIGPR